eukprot:COSAG02_NODE_12671_length_1511_cov_3.289660_1_plen_293_part_10
MADLQLPVYTHRGTDRQRSIHSSRLRPRSHAPLGASRSGLAAAEASSNLRPREPRPLSVQSSRASRSSVARGVFPVHGGGELTSTRVPRTHLTPWVSHVSAHGDDRRVARLSATGSGNGVTHVSKPRLGSRPFSSQTIRGQSSRKPRSAGSPRASHSGISVEFAAQGGSGGFGSPWSLATAGSLWDDDAATCAKRKWLEDTLRTLLGAAPSASGEALDGGEELTEAAQITRARIAAVQNVFEHLVADFRTCQHLLSAIKAEYDSTLRHWFSRYESDKPRVDRSRTLRELTQSE